MNSVSGGCFAIIIVGCFAVLYPIMITIFSFVSGSGIVIVSYFIALILIELCYVYIDEKEVKFTVAGLVSLVFAAVFLSCVSDSKLSFFDETSDKIAIFVGCFCLMIPCYFISKPLKRIRCDRRLKKIDKRLLWISNSLTVTINNCITMKDQIENYKYVINMVGLMEVCGADVSALVNTEGYNIISNLRNRINGNEKRIVELEHEQEELNIKRKYYSNMKYII